MGDSRSGRRALLDRDRTRTYVFFVCGTRGRLTFAPAGKGSNVIVRCPSCGTHYRHQPVLDVASGRCSRCEDTVPLVAAKRLFVLRAAASVLKPAGLGFGMDDPSLAGGLSSTALDVAPGALPETLTYRIASALPKRDAERLKKVVTGEIRVAGPGQQELAADSGDSAAALNGASDADAAPLLPPSEETETDTGAAIATNPLRETLVAMLMTSLGALAAYYICLEQGLDPVLWMVAGAGWGLVFGWVCIRWMRRGR